VRTGDAGSEKVRRFAPAAGRSGVAAWTRGHRRWLLLALGVVVVGAAIGVPAVRRLAWAPSRA
jgi:hypothetical protein